MVDCTGDGTCIQQCSCECYDEIDETTDKIHEVCTCGHREHNGNCPNNCLHNCQVVECHNYRMCKQKRPQRILWCHNGMCIDCAVSIGKIKFLDIKDDCPICMENKEVVEITCRKHNICLECWKEWSISSKQAPLTCPLCRESIWKWKGR